MIYIQIKYIGIEWHWFAHITVKLVNF